ncbi:hypothetical protein [Paenibacillus mesotrionivorans]|jgi:hypothetical protein|uniref:Uncharacterized protein n=1 Tax=Paenibacillus mesotrionivorans TaxID=3160968 RepID=A0ACC7P3A8_9BACL
MTQQKSADKNLQNEVKRLDVEGVNAHNAQQLNQDLNDRKHMDALNRDTTTRQ